MLFIWISVFGYSTQFSMDFEILANYKMKIEKNDGIKKRECTKVVEE